MRPNFVATQIVTVINLMHTLSKKLKWVSFSPILQQRADYKSLNLYICV